MTGKTTAYCLLGSNLGDRLTFLRRAAFALAATESVELVRGSSVYETAPWGKTDQPSFLNAAVKLRTALEPEALLDRFQEIERRLGRAPSDERWGPRPIDLDLALFGNRTIRTARLTVPHPHLGERLFALEPLLEIAPGLRDPATGEAYARVREALRNAERGTQNTECEERNAERGMLNAEQGDGESRGRGKGGRRAGPEVARIGPLILNAWLLDSAFEELKELFPSKPQTRNAKLETRNAKLETRNSKPETRNAKCETRNPKSETRNPKRFCMRAVPPKTPSASRRFSRGI